MSNEPVPQDPIDELGLSRYRKTIVALGGAVATWAAILLDAKYAAGIAVTLTGFGVYMVPNASGKVSPTE